MNRFKLLLIGSVALNIGLITLLAFTRASSPRHSPETLSAPHTDATAFPAPIDTEARRDYPRLLQSLLSRGFSKPEAARIVRDAALSDWIAEAKRLQNARPYWQPPLSPTDQLALQRQISQERRARETALAELLGQPAPLNAFDTTALHLPAGTSPAKIHAVAWLEEDYQMLLAETQTRATTNPETLQMLQRERHEDLAAILSPEELSHYEIRASESAHALRAELRFFEPSESEFRAIFHARQQSDSESAATALRESLGEERFNAYTRATDENFQNLMALAERFQLPQSDVLEVHRFANLLEEQQRQILDDANLTDDEKIVAIDHLLSEGREIVAEKLGAPAFEAYLNNGGWWLQNTP